MNENPLLDYYRQKEIYVKLPTGGKWYKNNPNLTFDGEIGVKAMSVRDELILTIPDALYNGQAIYQLIESICPDIDDPHEISLPDVDVLLLASRAASFDKKMPVETTCPHCNNTSLHELDLAQILSKVKVVAEESVIEIDGLSIDMRPNSLSSIMANNIKLNQTVKAITSIKANDETEGLPDLYKESLTLASAANIAVIADSIISVTLPDGTVVKELEHICAWLSNSNRKILDLLQSQQAELNNNGLDKQFNFTCGEEDCGKNFTSPVEFNPAFFFKERSLTPLTQTKLKK